MSEQLLTGNNYTSIVYVLRGHKCMHNTAMLRECHKNIGYMHSAQGYEANNYNIYVIGNARQGMLQFLERIVNAGRCN